MIPMKDTKHRYFLKLNGHAYSFTLPASHVQVHKWVQQDNKRYWNEEAYHDDYANGQYPITTARCFWDNLVDMGFMPVEKL